MYWSSWYITRVSLLAMAVATLASHDDFEPQQIQHVQPLLRLQGRFTPHQVDDKTIAGAGQPGQVDLQQPLFDTQLAHQFAEFIPVVNGCGQGSR